MFGPSEMKDVLVKKKHELQERLGQAEKGYLVAAALEELDDDPEFTAFARHQIVSRFVEKLIRDVKHREESLGDEHRQGVLEGFTHLQREYIVPRHGEQSFIPVRAMDDEEIDAKADQHRKMGDGHYAHADELVRFKEARRAKAS